MTYDEIIQEIRSGMSYDYEKDMHYIEDLREKYAHHLYEANILHVLDGFSHDPLLEERFYDPLQEDAYGINKAIYEAKNQLYKNNVPYAEKILRRKIQEIEKDETLAYQYKHDYYSYTDHTQKALYEHFEKKKTHSSKAMVSELYLCYGRLLVDRLRRNDAKLILEKALKWNGADVRILFEYADIFKEEENDEYFFALSKLAFKYAYKPPYIAKCCRNIGWYLTQKREWSYAVGYYLLSDEYENHQEILGNLQYIYKIAEKIVSAPSAKELKDYAKRNEIPFGYDKEMLMTIKNHAQAAWNEKDYRAAYHWYKQWYAIEEEETIRQKMDACYSHIQRFAS